MTSFFSNLGLGSSMFGGYQTSQPATVAPQRIVPAAAAVTQYTTQSYPPSSLTSIQQAKPVYREAAPIATVGVDTNHDGKANYYYSGVDRNHDGIPDALQGSSLPMATVGVDTNHDGRANYYYSGVDRNHDGIPDALQGIDSSYRVPHAVPHVHVQGTPIPLYEVHHLRAMPAEVLRVHANHVYRTLGPTTFKTSVPVEHSRLVDWLVDVHNGHLQPLRERAIPHSVPHVYVKGVPMPMYEVHHLRSMEPAQLRAHANHVVKTIQPSKPVPNHDHLLLDWLVEMHESHIKEHLQRLTEIESNAKPAENDRHHVIPHAVPHILVKGLPIPLYEMDHLQTMPLEALRAHAQHLYKLLGSSFRTSVPASDHLLVAWISDVHRTHIHPLRHEALQYSVPHVYYAGVPVPLYEPENLRSMEISLLRAHALHLSQTIRGINKPVPEHDHLLLDWLIEMHEIHLKEHVAKLRFLEAQSYVSHKPATTKDVHHVVPHAVRHIHVQGVPIPYYELHHLRAMSMDAVRAHAHYLYRTIRGLRTAVPTSDDRLIEWVVEAHNTHLHPLRHQAVQHSVPHIYYLGVPIPLYERHHFRSLTPAQLRTHANHLSKTIASISKPIPSSDDLLLEWLIEMHELHLLEHMTRLQQLEVSGAKAQWMVSLDAVKKDAIEPWRVTEEAAKLKDLLPLSDSDLQHIIMDTLVAHGLKATASTLRRECDLDRSEFPLIVDDKKPVLVPPDMSAAVAQKFNEAKIVNSRQHECIQECSEQVIEQRSRLQKLTERLHAMRTSCGELTEEEVAAQRRLHEQDMKINQLKLSAAAFEKIEAETKASIQLQMTEKSRLTETLMMRNANIQSLQEQIRAAEMQLEELKKTAEASEASQAHRIRQLLMNWDTPNGPKRVASQTFSQVDTDHDGRLEWATDEVCRFVRLLFHYHHVTAPPWADGVWYELYRLCDLDKSHSLDIAEALRFARGCFEAALRMLSGV